MLVLFGVIFACVLGLVSSYVGSSPQEIVFPRLLEARGINGELILHIRHGLSLSLKPTSVMAKNIVFTEHRSNEQIHTQMDGQELEKDLYQDDSKMAVVSLQRRAGKVEVDGVVGRNLRIAPLPMASRSDKGNVPHGIFKIEYPPGHEDDMIEVPVVNISERQIYWRPMTTLPPVIIPEVFTVEVKMISGPYHNKKFPRNDYLIRYMGMTLALASLRYADTSHPKIQFLLVAAVRMTETRLTPIHSGPDPIKKDGSNKTFVDVDETLKKLQSTYGHDSADVVVFATSLDLAHIRPSGISDAVAGVAFVGGLCMDNFRVAVIEDSPRSFSGVVVLTHEIGHSLGMRHDGATPYYGTKTLMCKAEDGYTMAPVSGGKNDGTFSPCSRHQLQSFVQERLNQACLDVRSLVKKMYNVTDLPITRNLTIHCRRMYPTMKGLEFREVRIPFLDIFLKYVYHNRLLSAGEMNLALTMN